MQKPLIVLIGSVALFISSCTKSKEATLSGEFNHAGINKLLLTGPELNNQADTVLLVDDKFSITLSNGAPGFILLKLARNRKELFLAPGYCLKISSTGTNIDDSIKYEGQGSSENIVLDSISKAIKRLNYGIIYGQTPVIAAHYVDNAFKKIGIKFNELAARQPLDQNFLELERSSLSITAALMKLEIGLKQEVKDPSFYAFMKSLDLENEEYLNIPKFRELIRVHLEIQIRDILEKETVASKTNSPASFDHYTDAALSFIEKIHSAKIRDYFTFTAIFDRLESGGIKNFAKYYEYFTKRNSEPTYAKLLQKSYELKLQLAPGKKAPEFSCEDAKNRNITLESFNGRYVYIDFWATWCDPCLQELPYYLQLQSDYKGKEIVFISLSIDNNKATWNNFLKEHKSLSVNLIADGAWKSDVAKKYQIKGVPTFILIDRAGKIIDSQAPRPSSKEIRLTLDELLLEKQPSDKE